MGEGANGRSFVVWGCCTIPHSASTQVIASWKPSTGERRPGAIWRTNLSVKMLWLGALSAAACVPAMGQSSISGITSNGDVVTVTAPGGLSTPSIAVNSTGAGTIVLQQGTAPGGAPAGGIQISAPGNVTAYTLTLPTTGPDTFHPLLVFSPTGQGSFVAMPTGGGVATQTVSSTNTMVNSPQTINGGGSSLPLVVTSNNANGASIALDNSSVGGNYTLFYSNAAQNTGLWDYTHYRDTLTCSETAGAVSCGATHVVSTSGQPTVIAGAGAGGGAMASFETGNNNAPSDGSGIVNVTTGSGPAANSAVATVTFNQSWLRTTASQTMATDYAPACTVSPANAAAASLSGASTVYVGPATKSEFAITSNATALAPATTYAWTYKCM